jgi:hypothetical protein
MFPNDPDIPANPALQKLPPVATNPSAKAPSDRIQTNLTIRERTPVAQSASQDDNPIRPPPTPGRNEQDTHTLEAVLPRSETEPTTSADDGALRRARPTKLSGIRDSVRWLDDKIDLRTTDTDSTIRALNQTTLSTLSTIDELKYTLSTGLQKLSQDIASVNNRISAIDMRSAEHHAQLQTRVGDGTRQIQEHLMRNNMNRISQIDAVRQCINNIGHDLHNDCGHRHLDSKQEQQDEVTTRLRNVRGNLHAQNTSSIPEEGVRIGSRNGFNQRAPPPEDRAGGASGGPDPSDDDDDDGDRPCHRNSPGTYEIKPGDIGRFDPTFEDAHGVGVVNDGSNTIFTDVYCFIERINTFLEDPETSVSAERQIMSHFQSLLSGPAIVWWTNEVAASHRMELRRMGLRTMLNFLKLRFNPDSMATRRFNGTFLASKDVDEDDQAMSKFVQKKLRWARSMGIIDGSIEPKMRQYLPPLKRFPTLSEDMQGIEKSRSILLAATHHQHQGLRKKPYEDKRSYTVDKTSHKSPSSFSGNRSHDRYYDRHSDWNRDRTDKYDSRDREQYRKHSDRQEGNRRRDNGDRDRDRDRKLDDRDRHCDRDRYKLREDAKNVDFRCPIHPAIASAEEATPEDDSAVQANSVAVSIAAIASDIPTSGYKVKDAPAGRTTQPGGSALGGYTHLRIAARIQPEGPNMEICLDPVASHSLIGRSFLEQLNYRVEHRKGKMKGVGEGKRNLSYWATFDIYLPGVENGGPTLNKFTHSAWVAESLGPNLLLGNGFLDAYGAKIDYETKLAHLQLFDFVLPFSIYAHSTP